MEFKKKIIFRWRTFFQTREQVDTDQESVAIAEKGEDSKKEYGGYHANEGWSFKEQPHVVRRMYLPVFEVRTQSLPIPKWQWVPNCSRMVPAEKKRWCRGGKGPKK